MNIGVSAKDAEANIRKNLMKLTTETPNLAELQSRMREEIMRFGLKLVSCPRAKRLEVLDCTLVNVNELLAVLSNKEDDNGS